MELVAKQNLVYVQVFQEVMIMIGALLNLLVTKMINLRDVWLLHFNKMVELMMQMEIKYLQIFRN